MKRVIEEWRDALPAVEYTMHFQQTCSGTPTRTVMTLSDDGGRIIVTFGVYGGTRPIWAYINQC